jgi:hypothetical protein
MSHFILLHGFNDKSAGANNIDKVAPLLEAKGHTVDRDGEDYGRFGLLKARFARHSVVLRVVGAIRRALADNLDVVVVGYSNGANYALKALHLVFVGKVKLVLVHPAVSTKFQLPESVSRCWVCYTDSDWAVRAASYVAWLIPGWGRAGAVGYKGSDPRIGNIDYSDVAVRHGGLWVDGPLQSFADDLHYFASVEITP